MAITKTTKTIRRDTSIPFFFDACQVDPSPELVALREQFSALYALGTIVNTNSISDDGLTETRVWTTEDISLLGEVETLDSIFLRNKYVQYRKANDFVVLDYNNPVERQESMQYAGIDSPYKVTTTYMFPTEDTFIPTFARSLMEYEHYNKKVDLRIGDVVYDAAELGLVDPNAGNQVDDEVIPCVTIIHQYDNSEDQTLHPFLDMFYIPQLAEKNVTRTIKYEYL
ncbi:hypothetical protein UFOVP112_351 [uncultured Caudovirales phage]|uniref:Uncharacterized protein n=1 Tax=uncultured Caudovirales phage TaxID=2100421 RepID=A0A6J5L7E5_9CAUD|nr:hypothetical protein UFOVP112_351 [uncultured Caudovirales phage]